MRAVVTRVNHAEVKTDGKTVGSIGKGFLVLLGVHTDDTEADAKKLADKISGLRIFEDENEKMNLSLDAVDGKILSVSQFTLYGNCRRGRRPEFLNAARPDKAVPLYELFNNCLREKGIEVETGSFGAYMQVISENDGPVTLILDTNEL